jgi:hypothetical protein
MVTKLFMDLRRIFADLASTLILGKNKDAADLAMILAEKSRALAEELDKYNTCRSVIIIYTLN